MIEAIPIIDDDVQTLRAVVLLSFPDPGPFFAAAAGMKVSFSCVPGLLAFREGPSCWRRWSN